jgi:PhzF family phenazine biosynthesis protein
MDFLSFKQVDVFTQKPFFGNPVAVVLSAEKISSTDMQRIAAWTNLSETTFVLPPSCADADYRLRIFTPKQELPFAGHPTIGSAHAVLESGIAVPRDGRLRQECLAGLIQLDIESTSGGARIFLHVPQAKVSDLAQNHARRLMAALGMAGDEPSGPLRIDVGVVWLVADLGECATVASLNPKLDQVQTLSGETQAAGITVFGRARNDAARLHVRSFAPILGVGEDPVCGSGNASVAAYLVHTGLIREIGSDYLARQGMAVGRAGEVAVRIVENEIRIGGYAVTCVDGRLRIQ